MFKNKELMEVCKINEYFILYTIEMMKIVEV